jgi:hypothetical protein
LEWTPSTQIQEITLIEVKKLQLFLTVVCANVGRFSMTFGCKIFSSCGVISFQSGKYEKMLFLV